MLKDLIVNLAVGTNSDPASDYAVSLAQVCGAHLTGTAVALKPVIPSMTIEGLGTNVIHAAINENQTMARAAINRFEALTKKQGVAAAPVSFTETLVDAVERFSKMARCFDLSILAQADPDRPGEQDMYIEAALFTSGQPILVVPYIQKAPARFDRITCCWDGSEHAARAIADAMPFLHKAKKIDLLMVTTAKTRNLTIVGTDIAQHLARHGLNVEIQQIKGADSDIASVVLSYVADNSADFLVMGGYGHSRWRELVLGGATRGILSSMTIPTLMSH
jgi:nucleotide-binding universal stress UspA family protein